MTAQTYAVGGRSVCVSWSATELRVHFDPIVADEELNNILRRAISILQAVIWEPTPEPK